METIIQDEGQNEKLNNKIKLLESSGEIFACKTVLKVTARMKWIT